MNRHIELLDYRRRVNDLYRDVRQRWSADAPGAHARWRAGRERLFAGHPQSPLTTEARKRPSAVTYFDYDPALAFTAPLREDAPPEKMLLDSGTGERVAFLRIGFVQITIGRLEVFWLDAYGGGLFVPFRDGTSGRDTYSGGRYLLDTANGADLGTSTDGALMLDFNFAYNPSSHYDATLVCPLAPRENWLVAPIRAGERAYVPDA